MKTVQYGAGYGLPTAVVDPSVYEGEILFATGASENACDRLVRLNPETGAFANVELKRLNDTIRYPVENADVILYADCKTGGGGSIVKLDKTDGENAHPIGVCAGSAEARAGSALRDLDGADGRGHRQADGLRHDKRRTTDPRGLYKFPVWRERTFDPQRSGDLCGRGRDQPAGQPDSHGAADRQQPLGLYGGQLCARSQERGRPLGVSFRQSRWQQ